MYNINPVNISIFLLLISIHNFIRKTAILVVPKDILRIIIINTVDFAYLE